MATTLPSSESPPSQSTEYVYAPPPDFTVTPERRDNLLRAVINKIKSINKDNDEYKIHSYISEFVTYLNITPQPDNDKLLNYLKTQIKADLQLTGNRKGKRVLYYSIFYTIIYVLTKNCLIDATKTIMIDAIPERECDIEYNKADNVSEYLRTLKTEFNTVVKEKVSRNATANKLSNTLTAGPKAAGEVVANVFSVIGWIVFGEQRESATGHFVRFLSKSKTNVFESIDSAERSILSKVKDALEIGIREEYNNLVTNQSFMVIYASMYIIIRLHKFTYDSYDRDNTPTDNETPAATSKNNEIDLWIPNSIIEGVETLLKPPRKHSNNWLLSGGKKTVKNRKRKTKNRLQKNGRRSRRYKKY